MMTTEETAWDSLSYAGKNHILFERQKHLLEEFLVRNAISREQYEKKTMDIPHHELVLARRIARRLKQRGFI